MTKRKISVLAVIMCLLSVIGMVCACNLIPNGENNNTQGENNSSNVPSGSQNNGNKDNGNEDNNAVIKYNLTVQDPNGYLIEELQAQYQAGEEVVVKTRELADENLMAYLDDELLGLESRKYEKGEYHWEYFFTMPARDATLSFKFSDGLTHKGIALDEEVQQEIITSFVNAYSTDRDPITAEEISLRCYGAFDGVYVLFVDVESMLKLPVIREQTIAGVKFIYSHLQTMVVYSNNAFYEIKDAYENNILSYDNMLAAQQTYKACIAWLYWSYRAEEGNGNEDNNTVTKYNLTVQDPNGYLIEDLKAQYPAGERVVVRTVKWEEKNLGVYLDGELNGFVWDKYGEWRYSFIMPAHDVVVSLQVVEGMTRNGLVLSEDEQNEIKAAFYNTHKDRNPDLLFDDLSLRCYGRFDGVYVIFEDGVWCYPDMVMSEKVADIYFVYPNGLFMKVYCDGAFYTLSEAYENGILSYDDLLQLAHIYVICGGSLDGPEPKPAEL